MNNYSMKFEVMYIHKYEHRHDHVDVSLDTEMSIDI